MAEPDSALSSQNSNSHMALEALVVSIITHLERSSGQPKSAIVNELRAEVHLRLKDGPAFDLANNLLSTALTMV
ncbi:TPA: hypothetical protein ACNTUM_000637 [Escherichia coli]|nr:hypothetical protein [Escherichia coli]HCO3884073.1 hypothetical protein [Escherichia coli]